MSKLSPLSGLAALAALAGCIAKPLIHHLVTTHLASLSGLAQFTLSDLERTRHLAKCAIAIASTHFKIGFEGHDVLRVRMHVRAYRWSGIVSDHTTHPPTHLPIDGAYSDAFGSRQHGAGTDSAMTTQVELSSLC